MRHAVKPASTVLFAAGGTLAVRRRRCAPCPISSVPTAGRRRATAALEAERALKACRDRRFQTARSSSCSRALRRLASKHKTDVFRDRVDYSRQRKPSANARRSPAHRTAVHAALAAVHQSLCRLATVEAGVVVDLLLSYRAASAGMT